jgi:hypothetical protein
MFRFPCVSTAAAAAAAAAAEADCCCCSSLLSLLLQLLPQCHLCFTQLADSRVDPQTTSTGPHDQCWQPRCSSLPAGPLQWLHPVEQPAHDNVSIPETCTFVVDEGW